MKLSSIRSLKAQPAAWRLASGVLLVRDGVGYLYGGANLHLAGAD